MLLAGTAWFAVSATHDYLAWNRARWAALADLTQRDHVDPSRIDGGFEFNALHYYGRRPARSGLSWWWVQDDEYRVAFGPMDGYVTLTSWRRGWSRCRR